LSVDLRWEPSASLDILRQRANALSRLREFFDARGYLEVETPVMARFGVTDRYLANIPAFFRGESYALQTSPEYHMKRLLAAGSGPIYQLARVFRDDELGRWHNPEFTLLEWYQLNIDHLTLLQEVDALLQTILDCPPLLVKTYRQAFEETCGIDPFEADLLVLKQTLVHFNLHEVLPEQETDRDQYLFLLMSHVVEPSFALLLPPVAVIDFPVSQASLAVVKHGVAERFEVYYRGVELANGFHELTDPALQKARFQADCAARKASGLPQPPHDEYLLAALHHGLPPCSGVALGIDRLLALLFNQPSIANTLAFDFSRA
jgi:lysyl-tRNA synthetase class 2